MKTVPKIENFIKYYCIMQLKQYNQSNTINSMARAIKAIQLKAQLK